MFGICEGRWSLRLNKKSPNEYVLKLVLSLRHTFCAACRGHKASHNIYDNLPQFLLPLRLVENIVCELQFDL